MPVVTLAPASVDVTTPVGSPPLRRYRHVVPLSLPTGPAGDQLEFDLTATRLRATFEPFVYDALAPGPLQGTKAQQGDAVVVTLDAPRAFWVPELTASAAADRPHLQLHRVDSTVLSVAPTVIAARASGNAYCVLPPLVDARVGLRGPPGGSLAQIAPSDLQRLWVRSDPAGIRIAVATSGEVETAVPFWQAPEPSVTSVDERVAFAGAVAAAVPTGPAPLPPSVSLSLVVSSDAPVRLQLQELTLAYRFVDRGFAPLPLLASDLTERTALVTMLRVPRDPVAVHLRSLLSADLVGLLDRDADASPALVERVLAELGAALEVDEVYDAARFADVDLPPGLAAAALGATGERRVRVNRLLVEAAHPEVLRPRQARRTLDLRDGAAAAVRLPPGAAAVEAELTTTEDLPTAGTPPTADAAEVPDADLGVEVTAERWVAARVTPPTAVTAVGVQLRAAALDPAARLRVELRQDHDGTPAGRLLATGETVLLAKGSTAWLRVGFEGPVVVPAGDHWVAALATSGRVVWMAMSHGEGRWARRSHDEATWSVLATAGRTPRIGLLSARPSPTGHPAVRVTVDGVVPASSRSGDRVTYDLVSALPGTTGTGAAVLRIAAEPTSARLDLDPPTIVYDVP